MNDTRTLVLCQAFGKAASNSKSEIEIFGKVVPLNKICDIAVAVT
jgi:hypothetical protein